MRRAVFPLLLGAVLLLPAACGTVSGPTPGATAAAIPTAAPELKAACEAIGEAYTKGMAPFAEAVAKAAGSGAPADRAQAQKKLGELATSIRTATAAAKDPQIVADGKQAADQLQKKAADASVFAALKTPDDASRLLGPQLKEWLSPVTSHCS
ncbi:hypothetical protein ACQPZX_26095 [Actinoplanes sp. CA-142083]|uniref:hypothetical protein n=1 Tax=Actinoplanes sp. CA-142083 TaxID=3239903 RepID=UPI003D8DBC7F